MLFVDIVVYGKRGSTCFSNGLGNGLGTGTSTGVEDTRTVRPYYIIYIVIGLEESVAVDVEFSLCDEVLQFLVAGHT